MPIFPQPSTFKKDLSGTLTADGNEQTIREIIGPVTKLKAYIDMTNMTASNVTVVSVYAKIKSGGTYRKHAALSYSGVQDPALIFVRDLPASQYGLKLTLQQTAGTNRAFDWITFTEG